MATGMGLVRHPGGRSVARGGGVLLSSRRCFLRWGRRGPRQFWKMWPRAGQGRGRHTPLPARLLAAWLVPPLSVTCREAGAVASPLCPLRPQIPRGASQSGRAPFSVPRSEPRAGLRPSAGPGRPGGLGSPLRAVQWGRGAAAGGPPTQTTYPALTPLACPTPPSEAKAARPGSTAPPRPPGSSRACRPPQHGQSRQELAGRADLPIEGHGCGALVSQESEVPRGPQR